MDVTEEARENEESEDYPLLEVRQSIRVEQALHKKVGLCSTCDENEPAVQVRSLFSGFLSR